MPVQPAKAVPNMQTTRGQKSSATYFVLKNFDCRLEEPSVVISDDQLTDRELELGIKRELYIQG